MEQNLTDSVKSVGPCNDGKENTKSLNNMSDDSFFSEIHDRTERSKNILMYNIPESHADDSRVRVEHDAGFVRNTLSSINVTCTNFKAYRIGRLGDKPRPLKVSLFDPSIVTQCMKNKKQLSGPIKIGADLTILQRKQIREAYSELDRRKQNGEDNLRIKYIRGSPKVTVVNTRDPPKNGY